MNLSHENKIRFKVPLKSTGKFSKQVFSWQRKWTDIDSSCIEPHEMKYKQR